MVERVRRRGPSVLVVLARVATCAFALVVASAIACLSNKDAPAFVTALSVPDCGSAQLLAASQAATLTVVARNPDGSAASGQDVLFVAPESGPSGTFSSASDLGSAYGHAQTDGDGNASITFTANATPGVYLVSAILSGDDGAHVSFAITNGAQSTPAVSAHDARCRAETEIPIDATQRARTLIHGPVLLPAGVTVTGESDAATVVTVKTSAPTWFFWIDHATNAKFWHATHFVTLDATTANAPFAGTAAVSWPELQGVTTSPEGLVPPELVNPGLPRTSRPANVPPGVAPSSLRPYDDPAPPKKECAIIFYGLPDHFLVTDATVAKAFFEKKLGAGNVQSTTDSSGNLIPPTPQDLEKMLDAAKAAGCTTLNLYMGTHGGTPGLDKINDGKGGKTLLTYGTLADMLSARFGGSSTTTVNLILDACHSGAAVTALAGAGLHGDIYFAAGIDDESLAYEGFYFLGAQTTWFDGSYFTSALLDGWAKAPDLSTAFTNALANGGSRVNDPKPGHAAIMPQANTFTPPNGTVCVGAKTTVSVPLPGPPITTDVVGDLVLTGAAAKCLNQKASFSSGKPAGLIFQGVSAGTTTYAITLVRDTGKYVGQGTVTVKDCADGGTPPPPPPDGGTTTSCASSGACAVNLGGAWQPSSDADTSPEPTISLTGSGPTSASIHYVGGNGQQCGCNAYHLVVPLGRTFPCASTTLAFDYAYAGAPAYTNSPGVEVRFCTGTNCGGSFYGGSGFAGSSYAGHSNCAVRWGNSYPSASVVSGTNTFALASLDAATTGTCSGTFDTIDVHLQGYACFDTETGDVTISNVTLR